MSRVWSRRETLPQFLVDITEYFRYLFHQFNAGISLPACHWIPQRVSNIDYSSSDQFIGTGRAYSGSLIYRFFQAGIAVQVEADGWEGYFSGLPHMLQS